MNCRFCAKRGDATGLDYMKARYYGPAIGRFLSRDPVRQNDGLSMYAYVGGNPMLYVDPEGDIAVIIVPVIRIGIAIIQCWQNPACRAFLACVGAALKVGFEDIYKHFVYGQPIGLSNTSCKALGACAGAAAGAAGLKGLPGILGALIGSDFASWNIDCLCDKYFPVP